MEGGGYAIPVSGNTNSEKGEAMGRGGKSWVLWLKSELPPLQTMELRAGT